MAKKGEKRSCGPAGATSSSRKRPAPPQDLDRSPKDAGRAVASPDSEDTIHFVDVNSNEQPSAAEAEEGASSGADGVRSSTRTGPSSSASSAPEPARPAQAHHEQWETATPEEPAGPPPPFSIQELQQRVRCIVLTSPGKAVVSGERTIAGPPAIGLGIDLLAAIAKVFKSRSKDESKAMWGKVSQEETIGYALADILGYPAITAGEARTLGDPVRKRCNAAELQEKADLKEARRLPAGPAREKAIAVASSKIRDAVMKDLPLPVARGKSKLSASVVRALPAVPVSAADPAHVPEPAPKHGPTSKRFTGAMATRRAQLRREYTNAVCTCAEHGQPHVRGREYRSPDFVEHSMFCRMWHCYAYEAGASCCEVIIGDTVEEMHIGAPCDCLTDAFDFTLAPEDLNHHHVRGHVTEFGVPDRLGKRQRCAHTRLGEWGCRYCGISPCPGGRYLSMCPDRLTAKGQFRGDVAPRGSWMAEWRD
jgi:hypothetical protein